MVALTDKNIIMELAKFIRPYPCRVGEPKTPQQEMFKIGLIHISLLHRGRPDHGVHPAKLRRPLVAHIDSLIIQRAALRDYLLLVKTV